MSAWTSELTTQLTALTPLLIALVGAAIVPAFGYFAVRVGFRWIKSFLGGR